MMTALSLLAIPHRHSIPLQRRTCCRHHHRHLRDNCCGVPHHHSSLKNRRGAEKKSELQYIKSNVLRYALPSSMIGTSSSSQQQLHSHHHPLSSVFSRHVRIGRRFPALLSPHTYQLPLLAAVHPGNLFFSSLLASSTVRTTATTASIRRLELLNSSIISKSQQLNFTQQQRRDLSTTTTTTTTTTGDELCPEELEANIIRLSKSMAWGLMSRGYWTNFHPHYHHHHHHHNSNDENSDSDGGGVSVVDDNNNNNEDSIVIKQQQQQHLLLPPKVISNMRQQAMALRHVDKRYVQSVSESINIHTGQVEQFVKPGVYACEPDGSDYYTAPDILHYIATVLRTLPPILNDTILSPSPSAVTSSATTSAVTNTLHLRNDAFNAKLAVTCAGGYKYPRHVDNVSPPPRSSNNNNNDDDGGNWDVRKLTVILYLNPVWKMGDGGELRLYFPTPITMNDHSNNNNIDDDELSSSSSSSSTTNNYIDLSPVGGRVVLFWSDEISHEVLANAPHVVADNTLSSSSSSSSSMEDDASLFDRYALTIWIPSDNDSLRRSFIITPTTTTTTTTTTTVTT